MNGRVSVVEIAERFEISPATARRDVVSLAIAGKAVRNHGGLSCPRSFAGEHHFRARIAMQAGAKLYIAQKAAQILPHEGRIFVDAGTTCFEVGRLLSARPKLCIITNSIPIIGLASQAQATIIGIGGEVRRVSLALTGALIQPWLADWRFDAAVVGAAGLDPTNGAFTTEIHEAATKAEALRRAQMRVLVADADKWHRPTAMHFAPWNAFSSFVTNQEPASDARASLLSCNVSLHVTGAR